MIIIVDNSVHIDNVKGIVKALETLGLSSQYKVIKDRAQLCKINHSNVKGVILSGSEMMVNDVDMHKYADKFMLNMCVLTQFENTPTLAICFGCQLVNYVYGGSMRKLERKIDSVLPVKLYNNDKVSAKFNCKYVIEKIGTDMDTLGTVYYKGKEITCFMKHRRRPLFCTLFHPENERDTLQFLERLYRH
jgi:GMP synthase-like glutamine amidotransferase